MVCSMKICVNTPSKLLKWAFLTTVIGFYAPSAWAFDPSEGAEEAPIAQQTIHYQTYTPTDGSRYARGQGLPSSVVPQRYYTPPTAIAQAAPRGASAAYSPTVTPPVTAITPAYPSAAAPAAMPPVAVASSQAYVPPSISKVPVFVPAGQQAIYNTPAPAQPAYTPPTQAYVPPPVSGQTAAAQPAYTPPAAEPAYQPYPAADAQAAASDTVAFNRNRYTVGVEAFYDNYEEPDAFPDLHVDSYYGALTGSASHYFTSRLYSEAELRASYGSADYASNSGKSNGTPQWEFDTRFTGGYDFPLGSNGHLKTYAGIANRYYRDESKGVITNLGAGGYDRRITQVYAPIGLTYEFMQNGLTFAPTIEVDPLLYGYVESRLQTLGSPYTEANNVQRKGIGWRGELLMGQVKPDGTGWLFGPFVRYWDIKDSNIDHSAGGLEPHNNRLQLGTKLKFLF